MVMMSQLQFHQRWRQKRAWPCDTEHQLPEHGLFFVIFQAESGGEICHFCFILNVKRFMYVYVDIIHKFDFGLLMGLTDDTHTLSWAEGQSACVKMAAALWLPNTQPREDCKVRTVFSVKLIIKTKDLSIF